MRHTFAVFLLVLLTSFSAAAQAPSVTPTPDPTSADYVRPDAKTRQTRYFKSMLGPWTIARAAAGAGVSTAAKNPEEWDTHWNGFGKRFASNMGIAVISSTTRFGLDEALKLDSHFYRSKDRSFKARIKNAFISPLTARKTDGKRTLGIPNIVGTYTGHVVATTTWYPARHGWKDGMRNGTMSLGTTVLFNLFREFIKK